MLVCLTFFVTDSRYNLKSEQLKLSQSSLSTVHAKHKTNDETLFCCRIFQMCKYRLVNLMRGCLFKSVFKSVAPSVLE